MRDKIGMRPGVLVCICLIFAALPSAKSLDGDMSDPFCNVRVATTRRFGASTHIPKDVKRMAARLIKNRIENQVASLGYSPDHRGRAYSDWWITVYPPDASKARRLVEAARDEGWRIEPDYTAPRPVLQ